jgi:hypothetical protein
MMQQSVAASLCEASPQWVNKAQLARLTETRLQVTQRLIVNSTVRTNYFAGAVRTLRLE